MNEPNNQAIANEFAALTPTQQSEVLAFIRQLKSAPPATAQSREERRKAILALVGSISREDLEIMKSANEPGCKGD